jgi:uncharacterized protein (TIGR02453 family)
MFPGFSRDGLKFLRDLKKNNDREWFTPRKMIFDEQLRQPMLRLIEAVHSEMIRFAPQYVGEPAKCVYRIYRDTRFSKDKTPYKTHVGALLWHKGTEKNDAASFYFAVSPESVEVAGGLYFAEAEALLGVRTHIRDSHEELEGLLDSRKLRRLMGELQGDTLTRVPKGFDCAHPAVEFLKRKQFYLFNRLDAALAHSPKILKEIVSRFEAMMPLVEYLNRPLIAQKNRKKRDDAFLR